MTEYAFDYTSLESRISELEYQVSNLKEITNKLITENIESTNEIYALWNMLDTIIVEIRSQPNYKEHYLGDS
jgi:regulator of replication initiation timing